METPASLAPRPDHVPPALEFDFDLYNVPGAEDDIQLAYRAFQQEKPDIFWTPRNGGHWVATRAEDIEIMQLDHARFSHSHITIPKSVNLPPNIPLELDPPEHGAYRRPLTQALLPRIVDRLETQVRSTAISLIESFAAAGECEFVSQFAKILPIVVFLDFVDLPHEARHVLSPLAEMSVHADSDEKRTAAFQGVAAYLHDTILARRAAPGDDLLSQVINADIEGEKISFDRAVQFAVLVMMGGLDTVASMLCFVVRFLAMNPGHVKQLNANLHDEAFKRAAVEELLRRHGIANTAREIAYDFEYKGLLFRAGDMILPPNMLVGLDERKVHDPLTVDFLRPPPSPHATFGKGPHSCPGAILARRELKIFLEEWLPRIPEFYLKPGTKPVQVTGMVNGILQLELTWPRPAQG